MAAGSRADHRRLKSGRVLRAPPSNTLVAQRQEAARSNRAQCGFESRRGYASLGPGGGTADTAALKAAAARHAGPNPAPGTVEQVAQWKSVAGRIDPRREARKNTPRGRRQAQCPGSNPGLLHLAAEAQMVERPRDMREVAGSSPAGGTRSMKSGSHADHLPGMPLARLDRQQERMRSPTRKGPDADGGDRAASAAEAALRRFRSCHAAVAHQVEHRPGTTERPVRVRAVAQKMARGPGTSRGGPRTGQYGTNVPMRL